MTPASSAARRLSPLGCALAALLALGLSACGGGGDPASGTTAASQPSRRAHPHADTGRCQAQLGGFLGSMAKLRGDLAVGLSYEQYAAQIHGVRAAYDRIPVQRLAIDCLASAGSPGERALNQYIDAANAWGECLAQASCETGSIEPEIQHRWRVASHYLSEAR